MITPRKSKTKRVLIIATWAIAAHYNRPETLPLSLQIPFCSAWTTIPGFRHRHNWQYRNNNNNSPQQQQQRQLQQQQQQQRHERPLFSATASVPTKPEADATANNASETTTTYRDLFPPSDTITNGTLQLRAGDDADSDSSDNFHHTLYYEIHGTGPLAALFLHGGPGAGCFPNHARFFDPSKYTVVLLDQRGAGKSTPRGSVVDNTLDFLVDDCERLRRHLEPHFQKINNTNNNNNNCSDTATTTNRPWDVVLGGSWGATLGLAYSLKHPSAMKSLILRGICALRPSEVDWLFGAHGGSSQKMREAWKNFSHAVVVVDATLDEEEDNLDESESELDNGGRDTLHAYYDCMFNVAGANGTTADNALRLAAARSWMMWEMAVTSSAVQNTSNNISSNNSSSNNSNSSNNNDNNTSSNGLVLVSSPESNGGNWRFKNHLGEPMADDTGLTPEIMVSQLRMDIEPNSDSDIDSDKELPLPPVSISTPRPVNPIGESIPLMALIREASKESNNNNKTSAGRFRLPPDYVPAQAMLTCYYSVNDRFVMGNNNLLETSSVVNTNNNNNGHENESENDNSSNTPFVKIIGIQGGRDPICPPDTALDLLRSLQASTNNMELRIPMESGHSMYDPAIKHELVTATDRLADEFLDEVQQ